MATISILGLYNYEPHIFDDVTFPEGIDRATAISTILTQNAGLSLLYTDPDIMRQLLAAWSSSSQYSWEKLAATLSFEYNPIWNKDGTVIENESLASYASGSNEAKVSAFNESDYQNREKDEASSANFNGRHYQRTEQGNIGVTTTQQMIKEEREISAYNIYDQISADFKARFCVMVY